MQLENKTAIVTGAAGGIGRAIAIRLASEGCSVVVADMNGAKAEEVAKEINDAGAGKAIAYQLDVTKREEFAACVAKASEAFGRLDILFNNVGLNKPMRFLETTEENFDYIVKANTLSALIGTQEAAKQMIKEGHGGKIVCAASISSRQAYPNYTSYCISKFGVVALVQAAARELSPLYGITVNAYAPGVVKTPLWNQLDKDLVELGASSKPGEALDSNVKDILVGRLAEPEDIAGAALYLASKDSDYMTGQVLMIDGGMTLV